MTAHRPVRLGTGIVAALLLAGGLGACGSSDGGSAATTTTRSSASSSGSAPVSSTEAGSSSTTAASSTSGKASSSTSTTTAEPAGLEGASESPRSAPASGSGTTLLTGVRVGRNEGFERIVFEFAGDHTPGYRVRWADGPVLADASGEEVEVAGGAHLEVIMEPASGVDMTDGSVGYSGPDRIPVEGRTSLITDLVRTGDFEAVLTWVAGAARQVPFRVLQLSSPTRLVVDLQDT